MTDPHAPALAAVSAALADRTRATMLLALLDGRAWTAGELARHAGVAPSTASGHLARLVEAGLVTYVHQGRHRYIGIAGAEVAELLETMTALLPGEVEPPRPRSLRTANRNRALATARTCYDHLAGRLGVVLARALTDSGRVAFTDNTPTLTAEGEAWCRELGVDLAGLRAAARPMLRTCLDWTERRFHLAGSLAAAWRGVAAGEGWVVPVGTTRALRITDRGYAELGARLGIERAELTVEG